MPKTEPRTHRTARPKGRTILFLGVLLLSSTLMYAEMMLRFSP